MVKLTLTQNSFANEADVKNRVSLNRCHEIGSEKEQRKWKFPDIDNKVKFIIL